MVRAGRYANLSTLCIVLQRKCEPILLKLIFWVPYWDGDRRLYKLPQRQNQRSCSGLSFPTSTYITKLAKREKEMLMTEKVDSQIWATEMTRNKLDRWSEFAKRTQSHRILLEWQGMIQSLRQRQTWNVVRDLTAYREWTPYPYHIKPQIFSSVFNYFESWFCRIKWKCLKQKSIMPENATMPCFKRRQQKMQINTLRRQGSKDLISNSHKFLFGHSIIQQTNVFFSIHDKCHRIQKLVMQKNA